METKDETKAENLNENIEEEVITDEIDNDEPAKEETDLENGDKVEEEIEDDSFEVNLTSAAPADDLLKENENDTPVIKTLRSKYRDEQKAKRELEAEVKELRAAKSEKAKAPELGAKPTLEDFDYDDEAFEGALLKWHDDKKAVDAKEAEQKQRQEKAQQDYSNRLKSYQEEKAKLNIPDYDDGEAVVRKALSETQQGIIIDAADNPALVILALSQNPAKLKALSEEGNHIRFAVQLAKLESKMKTAKKPRTQPESKLDGGGAVNIAGGEDKELKRLEKEADKTGNRTALQRYKREKAASAA